MHSEQKLKEGFWWSEEKNLPEFLVGSLEENLPPFRLQIQQFRIHAVFDIKELCKMFWGFTIFCSPMKLYSENRMA